MKTLCSFLCLGLLSGGISETFAAAAIYDGDPSVPVKMMQEEKMEDETKRPSRGYTTNRLRSSSGKFRVRRGVGRSEYQIKQLPTSKRTIKKPSARSFRSSRTRQSLSPTERKTPTLQTSTFVATQRFESQQTDFSLELPKAFTVISDTLTEKGGQFVLRDGESFARITTTTAQCKDGEGNVPYCLREQATQLWKAELAAFDRSEKKESREVILRNEGYGVDSKQIALWSVYRVDTGLVGKLVFLEPQRRNVWVLTIDTPNTPGSLLNVNRVKESVLQSVFAPQKTEAKTSAKTLNRRRLVQESMTSRRSTTSGRSSTANFVGDSFYTTHMAASGEMKIVLPNNYVQTTDDLTLEGGHWKFESKEGYIVDVMPTKSVCDSQTPRIRRTCLEGVSKTLAKDMLAEYPDFYVLKTQNMQLQLLSQDSYKDDVARLVLWRNPGQRLAFLTFVHPQTHQVMTMKILSSEENDTILSDNRILNRVISSIRLKYDME